MNIAHMVSTFPPRLGGMGKVCFEESKRLQAQGHEVTVFTLRYDDKDVAPYTFKTIRLSSIFKWGDAGLVPQLFWFVRSFDRIHLHYPFYGGAEWVALAARWWHKPLIVTMHMEAAPTGFFKKIIQRGYDRVWARFILRSATSVIAVNHEHFKTTNANSIVEPEKVTVIENGVDDTVFCPAPVDWQASHFFELKDKKNILFVGNLLACKRLDLLIRAFAALSVQFSEAQLVVVGEGYEESDYRKLCKELGLDNKVLFTGACNDEQVLNNYYNAATCVVVSSDKTESFSLVISEALCAGCPVIASDIPSLKSRVIPGTDGWLFKAGDCNDLQAKLAAALTLAPADRLKLGEAGRKKMQANFSWTKHIAVLEKIYKQP